jgi:hypothetical protein
VVEAHWGVQTCIAVTLRQPSNPGRPTVSTPATLTPVGYLQFETGVLGASHSPEFSSRYGLNTVMKLSVASRLELITSAEPFVQYHADSTSTNGTAEVFLGAQGVLSRGEDLKPTSRQAIFAASTMAMCRSLILGALAIHFSFLPAGTLRDFTTTQTPSSMSKLKRLCIELSSARRSPFHITWWANSGSRVKFGISRSRSCTAMRLEIFGQ